MNRRQNEQAPKWTGAKETGLNVNRPQCEQASIWTGAKMNGFNTIGSENLITLKWQGKSDRTLRRWRQSEQLINEGVPLWRPSMWPKHTPGITNFTALYPSRCYNCQEMGHYAKECSKPLQPKRCHHCNSVEHLVAECPTRPQRVSQVADLITMVTAIPLHPQAEVENFAI